MEPRLDVIDGPLKGRRIPCAEGEISVGRESSNRLPLNDLAVSRRHCVIEKEGDRFHIRDLDSRNGTFVNGTPVKKRFLEHGDQIEIGKSVFVFSIDTTEMEPPTGSVKLDETRQTPRSTRITRYALDAPVSREVRAFLKISTLISLVQNLYISRNAPAQKILEQKLFELIFEMAPADRGAILVTGDSAEAPEALFGWDRLRGAERPVQVNRRLIEDVMRQRAALTSDDVFDKNATDPVVSLLCVPLLVSDRLLGIIYLDSTDPLRRFHEDDIQLATALAGLTALAIDSARRLELLESENRRLQSEINIEHSMIGESRCMRELYRLIGRVAPSDSTVLIRGESGTGKELVARAICVNSPRADKPFVAINCAALTETLLESELFGHEKGAFTGAIVQKRGRLEVADGGTVFLDEIGELAPALQAKLLRVLQEHEFERVGGTRTIKVDIRLIAATNRDLEEAIRTGGFRQDLYYRLNVLSLEVPPLREHREDIPLLASYFAQKFGKTAKRNVMGISPEARACLLHYDWPGNVRELENAIERAVVLGSSGMILPEDLPEAIWDSEPVTEAAGASYHEAVKETKKQLILKAIEQAGGNYTEAAKLLGVHANYLHRLIRNLNLRGSIKK